MPLTIDETIEISEMISDCLDDVLNEYDFRKYPAEEYQAFRERFSMLAPNNESIEHAMMWKWGHWGKNNYPQAHRNLIQEIEENWEMFSESEACNISRDTFAWWTNLFGRNTTYITAAYITHLVHFADPTPIIDRHNFRAMNRLKLEVRENHRFNKQPSSWEDIQELCQFMESLLPHLPQCDFSMLDRFLMMYGRSHVPR